MRSDSRWDLSISEIPEHLRYREVQVPNTFYHVTSRYTKERSATPPPPKPEYMPRGRIPVNPQFSRVAPRLLEPRSATPPPQRFPIESNDPFLKQHNEYRKVHWRGVRSKVLDKVGLDEGIESPREAIDRQRKEQKRETQWRGSTIFPVSLTFDEIRQRNKRYLKNVVDHSQVKPKKSGVSAVAGYIREGTPVRHHTTGEHYVSPRRAPSPYRWVPGGAQLRSMHKAQPSNTDEYINKWRAKAVEKKVERGHVPRVAHLAVSESFKKYVSESEELIRQRSSPPKHGGSEVVSGPATVAIPTGTTISYSPVSPKRY